MSPSCLVVVLGIIGGEDDFAVTDGEGVIGLGLGVDPDGARRRRPASEVVVGGRRRVGDLLLPVVVAEEA